MVVPIIYRITSYNVCYTKLLREWIESIIESEGKILGEINYIFCDDEYLHQINVQYLDHDTLTDIIRNNFV